MIFEMAIARWQKITALSLMLFQNASFVLVMRYSRKQQQSSMGSSEKYNVSLVVTLQEFFKLVLCCGVLASRTGGLIAAGAHTTCGDTRHD